MATHKLIPYWITVREAGEPNSSWDQTRLHAHESKFTHDNLADYFHDFLKDYQGEDDVYMERGKKKTFTVSDIKRDGNTIEGQFKSGEWGQNNDFWDVEDNQRIRDAREENHAEEYPYYFLFHIPDVDKTQALFIISKYKRKGIKSLFKKLFLPRNSAMDIGNAYMDIEPHYSNQVVKKIEEADKIASVRFRGNDSIPAREKYADRQNIQRVQDEISGLLEVGTELKVTPTENQRSFRQFVKELVPSQDKKNFEYGRIEDHNFDSANVTVVEGESQLTFSIWKEEIQMRMDLDPEDHDLDIYGGYPTPYSLGCVARQLANDLMQDRNSQIETESLIPRNIGVPEEGESDHIPAQD